MRRGAVIAFVGSEATGKSTTLDEMARRLGPSGPVRRIHVGKPPSTVLTFVPHALLPAFRAMFPDQRSTHVEARSADAGGGHGGRGGHPPLFVVRSLMLAYERRALLRHAFRWAAEGTVVLCDRYPARNGADGPQLDELRTQRESGALLRWLSTLEDRCYRAIPAPDVVIQLTAPLLVTLERNASRDKREPEDYVRRRHAASAAMRFEGVDVHRIDTDQPLPETMDEAEGVILAAVGDQRP